MKVSCIFERNIVQKLAYCSFFFYGIHTKKSGGTFILRNKHEISMRFLYHVSKKSSQTSVRKGKGGYAIDYKEKFRLVDLSFRGIFCD